MTANVGGFDRVFRITLGLAVMLAGMALHSWWGALGAIPFLTGAFRWCPVYAPFGMSTCPERAAPPKVRS